ncbi:MAG: glycosyltransferase [Candidatus Zixiibacteriota bacterium]
MGDTETKFRLAVIIPVRDEERFLDQTLDQLYLQDFPMDSLEVAVVDGGSRDRTRGIAESFKSRFGSLKVLDNPRRISSSGRNIGVQHTTAPYIVFLNGHTYIPSKNFLKDIIATFEATGADCLCRARPLTPPDINEFEWAVAVCRGSALGHNPVSQAYTDFEGYVDPTSTGAMYRREVFTKVGLFDEAFDICNDVEFNHRVRIFGLKSYLSPKLKVFHYPRGTIQSLWNQMTRIGAGRFNFTQKHQIFSPLQWFAGLAVLFLALMLVLSLVSSPVAEVLRTMLAFYILIVVLFSLVLSLREKRIGCLLYGPVIFPAIHFGLGVGFLKGMAGKFHEADS